MPTECNHESFEFPSVEGRHLVASFDGGAITSDAGALLLGQNDRAIRLTDGSPPASPTRAPPNWWSTGSRPC